MPVRIFLGLVVAGICPVAAFSQSVLDGVYVKEHIPTRYIYHKGDVLINPNPADSHAYISHALKSMSELPELNKPDDLTYINYIYKKAALNTEAGRATPIGSLMSVRIKNGWITDNDNSENNTRSIWDYVEFLKYYVDANTLKTDTVRCTVSCNTVALTEKICNPFYIKNTEVTNAEYREFYYWVRDSIVRRILGNNSLDPEDWLIKIRDSTGNMKDQSEWNINWEVRIRWNDEKIKPLLSELYYPENMRYYTRKEIDTRKMIYKYAVNGIEKQIAIYPDTLCWPAGTFNNPKTNMYFWHSAYNHYPVVGLSYDQTQAFLHWKTKMHNLALHRKKQKYKVEYKLPDAIEWYVTDINSKNKDEQVFLESVNEHLAQTWKEDLYLNLPEFSTIDTLERVGQDIGIVTVPSRNNGPNEEMVNALIDENLNQVQNRNKNLPVGVISMSDNVSEWLRNDLSGFVKLVQAKNHAVEILEKKSGKTLGHLKIDLPEVAADSLRMIKGGNWFNGKHETNGVYKKAYVHQKTQSAMIGFRYVLHVIKL